MSFNPQKPSKARAEIGKRTPVVASNVSPIASSPAPGMRDPQPASRRGGDAGQQPTRSVRPIPAFVLDSILDRRPNLHARMVANDRAYREAERRASGGMWGKTVLFAVAVVIAVLLATGGRF